MHRQCKKTNLSAAGYTLIELMLALAIGVIALSATLGMYTNYKNGIRATENTLTMQTNARFAFNFIADTLRNVGTLGCRSNKIVAKEDPTNERFIGLADKNIPYADFHYGRDIEGYEAVGGSWNPLPVLGYASVMSPDSDAIKIAGAVGDVYITQGSKILATDTQVQLNMAGVKRVDLVSNGYAVISNCESAHIFKVTSSDADIQSGRIGHAAGTGDGNLMGSFEKDALGTIDGFSSALDTNIGSGYVEVRRMATTSYYVADNASGIPTLYRDVDNVSTELVTGVEQMQIEYGLNTDTTTRNIANLYLNADQIAAGVDPISWANVVSVRISFTMRSYDPVYNVALSNKKYTLPLADGSTNDVVSNDRYARYKYTSTVTLRNRIIGM